VKNLVVLIARIIDPRPISRKTRWMPIAYSAIVPLGFLVAVPMRYVNIATARNLSIAVCLMAAFTVGYWVTEKVIDKSKGEIDIITAFSALTTIAYWYALFCYWECSQLLSIIIVVTVFLSGCGFHYLVRKNNIITPSQQGGEL